MVFGLRTARGKIIVKQVFCYGIFHQAFERNLGDQSKNFFINVPIENNNVFSSKRIQRSVYHNFGYLYSFPRFTAFH